MKKIGILTFHYSNNYGGVLQALCLQNVVESLGYDVEVINFVPSYYKPFNVIANLGIRKNIFKNKIADLNIIDISKKISIMKTKSQSITNKFNIFREKNMNLSKQVDENSLKSILNNYEVIIVGSDQIWNPSQRKKPEYFLDFGTKFNGRKISYAADSTTKDVNSEDIDKLKRALSEFSHISVRNKHSFDFVNSIISKDVEVVADPTVLYDFTVNSKSNEIKEDYILAYVLGKEIDGTHNKALELIKNKFGNLPVYSIKIPTMNFELSHFADKVFYDLDPEDWLNMLKNAKFIYTDSFHGVLFSLKYHKPFLAYYTEEVRATRFIDLGKRYEIGKYIVQNVDEIDKNEILESVPDFKAIDSILYKQRYTSLKFLENALK